MLTVYFKEQRREGLHLRETEAGLVVSQVRGNQNVWVAGEYRYSDLPGPLQGKALCDNPL